MRDHHPYRFYGIVWLLVIAALLALCMAAFLRVLTPKADVTVQIKRAGLQLLPGSDVKERGLIVGQVKSITSNGDGATLNLELRPAMLKHIPANVQVRLVPKTLFGEKYVDLVVPDRASTETLKAHDVITEDRSTAALEIDQAFNDLLPLLRAVQPAQLDQTLTAVATALEGRGTELGHTITQFDTYLKGLNPHLPQLKHDMQALSSVSRTYDEAAGPLLDMLGNLTVTSHTVVDEQQQISALLNDVTGAANVTRDFLGSNERNLIRVNTVNTKVIRLLKRYSPEIPCFIRGDAGLVPRIHDAVPKTPGLNHAAHVKIEFVPAFPVYQNPIDLPEFKDTRGPNCYGLPHPKLKLPVIHYKDGTQDDPRFAHQGESGPAGGGSASSSKSSRSTSLSMGNSGTAAERSAFSTLLGPVLGMSAKAVPDIADLLWGPMARGSSVKLQ